MKPFSCLAALIAACLTWPVPAMAAPIHEAARKGDVAKVRQLLEAGADINAQDQYEGTPLNIAVAQGQTAVVQFLLDKGAAVTAPPPNGVYNLDGLLLTAARGGHVGVLKLLLQRKANGGKPAKEQLSALLREAVQSYGGADAAKFLIEQGADVNDSPAPAASAATGKPAAGTKPPQEPSLLMLTTSNNAFNLKMISLLIAHGAKTRPDENGDKILIGWAAAEGKVDTLRKLLDEGADANTCLEQTSDVDCLEPLEPAVRNNKLKAADLLLRHGATLNSTHFAAAICGRNLPLLKLLASRAPAATGSDSDYTPLGKRMYSSYLANAVACGDKATLAYLMAKAPQLDYENITQYLQGQLNPYDTYGQGQAASGPPPDAALFAALYAHDAALKAHASALLGPALMGGRDKFANFLYGKGASLSETDAGNALLVAASDNHAGSVELLLDRGARSDVRSGLGNTPLLRAAPYGNTEAAAVLLAHGANVNAKNVQYNTPLHLAAARDLMPMAELLIRHGARVNAVNGDGNTPLHQAARFTAQFDVLRLLLENKAKPDIRSRSGMTPLLYLMTRNASYDEYAYARSGAKNEGNMQPGYDGVHPDTMPTDDVSRINAARLLMRFGADPDIRNQNGDSAIELERRFGKNPEMLRLLASGGKPAAK